jgi:predicted SprT family Zn-dependent metalloprotease
MSDPEPTADSTPPADRQALVSRAAAFAATVPLDIDLEAVRWTVSDGAKRRAGSTRVADREAGRLVVDLNWSAYETLGWADFRGVVRHELVHVWQFQRGGAMDHGPTFRRKADEVDAPRHCEQFTEPRYRLTCATCGTGGMGRHRRSKVVKHPDRYGHRDCDCAHGLRVRDTETGTEWTDHDGFVAAFDDINADRGADGGRADGRTGGDGASDRYRLECAACDYASRGCDCPDAAGLRVHDSETGECWE